MLARVNDAGLPLGPYELRARASDLARNEASTNLRLDGQPMVLNLPLRVVSTLQSAFETETLSVSTQEANEERRRRADRYRAARVRFDWESARIAGRLVDPAGVGVCGR